MTGNRQLNFLLHAALLSLAALLLLPSSARADIAPPHQPPGSNLDPGAESTQVRMEAETVLITVQATAPTDSLGQAHVTADFTMRNLGSQDESMAVRFPIGFSDGDFKYPEIQDVAIRVNDKPVRFRRVDGPEYYYEGDTQVPWAEFDVVFPADKNVSIEVSYDLEGTGEEPFIAFYYLLETGAGWNGTIGDGEIIVRLPYDANMQNVILDEQIGWSQTTAGAEFSENEIRWHFSKLEPEREDNFEVSLVMPKVWKQVLAAQEKVNTNPQDGEAWGRLGKAYKEIWLYRRGYRQDAGGRELYAASVQAYERALELLPEDAQWHAGFADLLGDYAYYGAFEGKDVIAEAVRALDEIHTALKLAPNDAVVLEIAEKMAAYFPDGMQQTDGSYDFPWLTATPAGPTNTPTAEAEATAIESTPTAAPELTATTETGSRGQAPLCGGVFLPIMLLAILLPCSRFKTSE